MWEILQVVVSAYSHNSSIQQSKEGVLWKPLAGTPLDKGSCCEAQFQFQGELRQGLNIRSVFFPRQFAIVKSVWQFAFDTGPSGTGSLSQDYADWVRWLETHWHIDHFVQKKNELGPAILCLQHPAILFHLSFCSTNLLLTIHSYHESCLSVWSAKQQIRSPLAHISLSRVATSSEPLCLGTQFAIVAQINRYK